MRVSKFATVFLFLLLIPQASSAATPEYIQPTEAYQKKYDMTFSVWKPFGLQNRWYATYDGYPVTEIAKDQWVYGVFGNTGELAESLIVVGSVDPGEVHILTPLPSFVHDGLTSDDLSPGERSDSLKEIFNTKCDNFGIAYTNASFTPIAWEESDTSKVYLWGGEKWIPIYQGYGERMSDAVKRDSYVAADMLRKNRIMWSQLDTYEFANYVRSAGYTWIGDFEKNMPSAFNEMSAGSSGGGGDSTGGSGSGTGVGGSSGGGWDTGR